MADLTRMINGERQIIGYGLVWLTSNSAPIRRSGIHRPDDFRAASSPSHPCFALCGILSVKPYFQNCFVAMRAPSAIAANLAHTTSGSTAAWPTQVP
jgi:hypothetical protein